MTFTIYIFTINVIGLMVSDPSCADDNTILYHTVFMVVWESLLLRGIKYPRTSVVPS